MGGLSFKTGQSLYVQATIVPFGLTVKVLSQSCSKDDVTQVSTLPPSTAATALSGLPQAASNWLSGTATLWRYIPTSRIPTST